MLALPKNKYNPLSFLFCVVEKEDIITELHKLNPKKVTQKTDIAVTILKDNEDFFTGYFLLFFNYVITSSKFLSSLKMTNIKETKCLKEN